MSNKLFNTWEQFAKEEQKHRILFGQACAYIDIEYARISTDVKNLSMSNKLSRLLIATKDDKYKFIEVSKIATALYESEQTYKAKKGFCELYKAKIINEQSNKKYQSFGENNYKVEEKQRIQ